MHTKKAYRLDIGPTQKFSLLFIHKLTFQQKPLKVIFVESAKNMGAHRRGSPTASGQVNQAKYEKRNREGFGEL